MINKKEYNSERRRKLASCPCAIKSPSFDKKEYNSDRRRKLLIILSKQISYFLISENITPIGDGNTLSFGIAFTTLNVT